MRKKTKMNFCLYIKKTQYGTWMGLGKDHRKRVEEKIVKYFVKISQPKY